MFSKVERVIRCTPPKGFVLEMVPDDAAIVRSGPRSIHCGHTLFSAYRVLAMMLELNVPIEVTDVIAASEHNRNGDGVRPAGFCGGRLGVTLHRCDVCARADELRHTAVCPCCANTIPPGEQVALVGTGSIVAVTRHPELLPLSMTAVNRLLTLVCGGCGIVQLSDREVDGAMIWSQGSKVTILRGR